MPIQTSGQIAMTDIVNEFGGAPPHAINEYYRNGGLVTPNNTNVPTSGQIAFSNFYGATRGITITDAFDLATNTKFGRLEFYQGNPFFQPWAGNPQSLLFPVATPFAPQGNYDWPIYCGTSYWPTFPDPVLPAGQGSNALVFHTQWLQQTGGVVGVVLTRPIIGGGLFQNNVQLYTIIGAETWFSPSQNINTARFRFNGDLLVDLNNRRLAGNTGGYELRITYVP